MQDENRLDIALASLGSVRDPVPPEGFMDGVWMRAGRLEEVSARRGRLAFFAAMTFIALGAGFGTTQAPGNAQPPHYRLIDGADLSPAALLHVEP